MSDMTCIIVDDEPLAVRQLAAYAERTPDLQLLDTFTDSIAAINAVKEQKPDLLFLDIQMPNINGMELARSLPMQTRVVFTTAFEQYALDGYRINALDYLMKPISYAEFLEACNKALQWYKMVRQVEEPKATEATSIFVKSEYKLLQIDLDDIRYIEGLKDYVKIYTEQSPHPILSLMNMKAIEQMLPSSRFIRVHRSFIVQKSKIREIDRNRIVYDKDLYIPIGDSYRQAFLDFLGQ